MEENKNLKYFKNTIKLSELKKLSIKHSDNDLAILYTKKSLNILDTTKKPTLIKHEFQPIPDTNPQATRIKQRTFFDQNGNPAYIEAFNYKSLAEGKMMSRLYIYKENSNYDNITSSIGYRYYLNGNEDIGEGNYITLVIDNDDNGKSIVLEKELEEFKVNNLNEERLLTNLFKNDFLNKEGSEISGIFTKELGYFCIKNKELLKQELEQDKLIEEYYNSKLKFSEQKADVSEKKKIKFSLFGNSDNSSSESEDEVIEFKYLKQSEKEKLKIELINGKQNNEKLNILKNNKVLFIKDFINMGSSDIYDNNDNYFKKIFSKIDPEDKETKEGKIEHILSEFNLNRYKNTDKIIIVPIALDGHATTMLIDTKANIPYLFDSSTYHLKKEEKKQRLFQDISDNIQLLNNESIQINGCCTYWSMSFVKLLIENRDNKYDTMEQIKQASITGQLQLDISIKMGKIFDKDSPTIIKSKEIDENKYVKIKIDNNNIYGINKDIRNNKFLKLDGLKEFIKDKNKQNEIDNLIYFQNYTSKIEENLGRIKDAICVCSNQNITKEIHIKSIFKDWKREIDDKKDQNKTITEVMEGKRKEKLEQLKKEESKYEDKLKDINNNFKFYLENNGNFEKIKKTVDGIYKKFKDENKKELNNLLSNIKTNKEKNKKSPEKECIKNILSNMFCDVTVADNDKYIDNKQLQNNKNMNNNKLELNIY